MWGEGRALWGNEGWIFVYRLDGYKAERELHEGKTGKKLNFPSLDLNWPLLGVTSKWSFKNVKHSINILPGWPLLEVYWSMEGSNLEKQL